MAVLLSQLVVLSKGHQTAKTEWIIMVVSLGAVAVAMEVG